jgi:NitT/TauT family transport system ATP-binding protein
MTARRNVEVVLDAIGLPPEEIRTRVEDTIRIVGLTGFEDAYPRELSGGMKQRVGMARALAVNPELLFLDEPFSAVDALTAESLRAEVIDIWSMKDRNPSSLLMVSHDIPEVAWMADRIVVLSARPGRISTVIENRLPRPRDYRSRELLALVDELHDVITGHELPDHVPARAMVEPLPATTPSEIVGLLEYLDARGGADDLPRIAAETGTQFDHVVRVVQGAEMLGFVDTPRRRVVLTSLARRYLASPQDERKRIWQEQILAMRLFCAIDELFNRSPSNRIDADVARGIIAMQLPQEDHDRVFEQVVRWARFGDLFDYDEATGTLIKEKS